MPENAPLLDTYRPVETPEGVELGLEVAGPVPRLLAWSIDVVLRVVIYLGMAMVLVVGGEVGQGLMLIGIFLVEWFYPVLFEVLANGATPGKKLFGLMVIHDDGTPVGWTPSVLRNLVRFADFLPFAYGFGLVTMLFTRDFKRLGDLAAGTVVVHREPDSLGFSVKSAPPVPPPVKLELPEQLAVINFAKRLATWSDQRARELAVILRPLTGAHGHDGVARLLGMANWLLGRR